MIKDIPHCYLLTSSLLPVTTCLCLMRIGFLSMPAVLIKNSAYFQSSAQRILFLFTSHSSLFTLLSSLFSLRHIMLLLYISVLCVFPSSKTVVVPLSVLPFLLWRRVIVMSVLSYKIFSVKSPKSLGSCG